MTSCIDSVVVFPVRVFASAAGSCAPDAAIATQLRVSSQTLCALAATSSLLSSVNPCLRSVQKRHFTHTTTADAPGREAPSSNSTFA